MHIVWSVEFYLGQKFYLATEPLSYDGEDYLPGLVRNSADRFYTRNDAVAVEINTAEDWPLAASSVKLSGFAGYDAILRQHKVSGTTVLQTEVLANGPITALQWGEKGEALSFEISSEEGNITLLHPQAICSEETQPADPDFNGELPEDMNGAAYPLIIGYPGTFRNGVPKTVVPVPAGEYLNTNKRSYWIIADGVINATDVDMLNVTDNKRITAANTTLNANISTDLLGRKMTSVSVDDLLDLPGIGDEVAVGFQNSSGYGGGIEHQGRVVRTITDIVIWALQTRTDVAVNVGMMEANRQFFDRYKFDTYVNDPSVDLWSWLDGLLKWVPGELVKTTEGYALRPNRWTANATEVEFEIEAGQNATRLQDMSSGSKEIYNELTLEFCPSRDAKHYYNRIFITDKYENLPHIYGSGEGDDRVIPSWRARVSRSIYGYLSKTISIPVVWDVATAFHIAEDLIAEHSLPKFSTRYKLPLDFYHLEPGMIGKLTDDSLDLSDRIVTITDVTVERDAVIATVRILDDGTK